MILVLAVPPHEVPQVVISSLRGCGRGAEFKVRPLRHAAVSTWLNAGVPAPEVAARAGHSVDVLMKVYAKCLDGQRNLVNQRIAAVLGREGK